MKFPKSWSALKALLNVSVQTKVKHILVTVAVAFGVFSLVFSMVETNGNRDVQREGRANDLQTYQALLRVYDTQVTQVASCNARFESRLAIRQLFISQNETVRNILNIIKEANPDRAGSPIMLAMFAELDAQDGRIAIEFPADETNKCNPLPEEPVVPESLAGSPEDETGDRVTVPATTP